MYEFQLADHCWLKWNKNILLVPWWKWQPQISVLFPVHFWLLFICILSFRLLNITILEIISFKASVNYITIKVGCQHDGGWLTSALYAGLFCLFSKWNVTPSMTTSTFKLLVSFSSESKTVLNPFMCSGTNNTIHHTPITAQRGIYLHIT